jgi:opacity protein-like surface antigen
MKKIAVLAAAVALTAASASAAVSIKLTGGLTYVTGNDYNSGVQGALDFLKANYDDVRGTFRPFHSGGYGGAEIIAHFGNGFGVGLGVGRFRIAATNTFEYAWWEYAGRESYEPSLTVIPVMLNLHYRLPAGSQFSVDIFGGFGYYLSRFEHTGTTASDFYEYSSETTFTARKNILGFQGGAALEYALGAHLALFVQAEARQAQAANVVGDWALSESWFLGSRQESGSDGVFWVYHKSDASGTYPQITFAKAEPSDSTSTDVRQGKLDISGFTAAAGLVVRF